MKRLAYVRLLYQQAQTQSYSPPPLNFSAVLGFHDVLEFFFVIADNHLGSNQQIDLARPFSENVRKLRAPDGQKLFSLDAVSRLNSYRNAFKHNGAIPGPDQIEQSRRDATQFLEGNCPRLFGVTFADISMLHIVPQDAVRDHLKAGRTAADNGDLRTGMGELALAFDRLLGDWGKGKYLPGASLRTHRFGLGARQYRPERRIDVSRRPSNQETRDALSGLAVSVAKEIKDVDEELESIRDVLRVQIAGVDMAGYVRFAMIAPSIVVFVNGRREPQHNSGELHYTTENYDAAEMFVVESSLRVGQKDFTFWMPQTMGDWDRAQAAMAANGGRLPEDMA